jgi:amino-acid N-acetyltransferase
VSSIQFRDATRADEPELRRFLQAADLPADDVSVDRQAYTLAVEEGRIVGSIGLEVVGREALVRSLAVDQAHRRHGLGAQLDDRANELARRMGLTGLYLLTTTAREYALRRGYEVVQRAEVPAGIMGLPQFRGLCPASATCMRLRVAGS